MGWIRCECDAHRKQVDVKQLYNPVLQTVQISWSQSVGVRGSENQLPAEGLGPQGLRLSSPAEWEISAAIVRGTWGQYVAVCSVSNSPLTHNPFATFSRIKCERYIFLKKCIRSSLLLIMFPHVYVCVLLYHGYTTVTWHHIIANTPQKDSQAKTKKTMSFIIIGGDNFSFLTRHLTDGLQAENG